METTGRATDPNSRSHASAIDTKQLIGRQICVELYGGRKVRGTLRGIDALTNMVLDCCEEYVEGTDDRSKANNCLESEALRALGAVVVRGVQVSCIYPDDIREIENPF